MKPARSVFTWRRWSWLAAGGLLAGVLAACTPSKSPPPEPPATNAPPAATRPVVSGEDAAAFAPFAQRASTNEADRAWLELEEAVQRLSFPPEWQITEPSPEDLARFEKSAGPQALKAADLAKDFHTRFPRHERTPEARKLERQLLGAALQFGQTNLQARLNTLEEAVLKDPALSEDDRLEVRLQQLQRALQRHRTQAGSQSLKDVEQGARTLRKEFAGRPEVSAMLLAVAEGWLDQGEIEASRNLATDLAQTAPSPDVKDAVQELLKKLNRVGQPLELKFKALDGRAVDLQGLKGKVVLVDFWATWCRPCLAELPNVRAAYEKLHPQGFEIIGISFDDDRAALERFLAREKIPWPQYFDEEDAGRKFGEEFGIVGIPTMWLVDKQGRLRDLNARENLAAKVEKLLAEK